MYGGGVWKAHREQKVMKKEWAFDGPKSKKISNNDREVPIVKEAKVRIWVRKLYFYIDNFLSL